MVKTIKKHHKMWLSAGDACKQDQARKRQVQELISIVILYLYLVLFLTKILGDSW